MSDAILQRAIDLDSKLQHLQSLSQHNKSVEQHGISQKFLNYFQSVDKTIGERALGPQQTLSGKVQATYEQATQQARAMDQQKGYSKIASDVRYSLSRFLIFLILVSQQYYAKAKSSEWGQKVKDFYTNTSKQIIDIHEEARRISLQSKAKNTTVVEAEAEKAAPTSST